MKYDIYESCCNKATLIFIRLLPELKRLLHNEHKEALIWYYK